MNWAEWTNSPGRKGAVPKAYSRMSPALVSHRGDLWCFWVKEETDEGKNVIYHSKFVTDKWTDPKSVFLNDTNTKSAKCAPQATSINGILHVMFIDEDDTMLHYKWDGDSLVSNANVTKEKVDRFCMTGHGAKLHCIYRLLDKQTSFYSQYSEAQPWGVEAPVRCEQADGPCNPILVPSLEAENDSVRLMKWGIQDLQGWIIRGRQDLQTPIPRDNLLAPLQHGMVPREISATSAAGMLFMSYLINSNQENIETLHYKKDWHSETIYGETALSIPALAVHNGKLFCVWNDKSSEALRFAMKPVFLIWSLNSWMASVKSERKLSKINIPGTHDSCAKSYWPNSKRFLWIERFFGTQAMDIKSQLMAGVRFLDIRGMLEHNESTVPMACHNIYFVEPKLSFQEIFDICYKFLDSNKMETIIMSIKCDENHRLNAFANSISKLVKSGGDDRWFLASNGIPTLGDVRGKIVLFRRFLKPADRAEFGIDCYTEWPENASSVKGPSTNGVKLMIQDQWNLSAKSEIYPEVTANKFSNVERMLELANENAPDEEWYLNFTSGSAPMYSSPSWIARGQEIETESGVAYVEGVNHRLLAYLEKKGTGHFGTIIMDFVDTPEELISVIINTNNTYSDND